jgi:hypothetical protein
VFARLKASRRIFRMPLARKDKDHRHGKAAADMTGASATEVHNEPLVTADFEDALPQPFKTIGLSVMMIGISG